MRLKLQYLFDLAEADRKKILSLMANLSEDKFLYRNQNKWSISQILTHLITAERYSLEYMKKKSPDIHDIENSGIWEDLKYLVLLISQRLPLKYKAPKILKESPTATFTYDMIEKEWDQVRNDLKSFMDSLDDRDLKKKIYKHPYSGRLNIIQAVSFFREHANHHLPQIKRPL